MAGGPNSKRLQAQERVNRNLQLQQPVTVTDEDFYDGIPRFPHDYSFVHKSRSTQPSTTKVSEVSSCLDRASTIGYGKAGVLVIPGSSMMNLNAGCWFVSRAASGAAIKGSKISILAFEVANTVVKGLNLLQSLSTESIRHLKEEVLLSEAVQDLVSKDMIELLRIVAADKRQELKVFSDAVVCFGNRSKDPRWHNLDRFFEMNSKELNAPRPSGDEAEIIMQQLMTLVQFTAEFYHGLLALDRLDYDWRKWEEEDQRGDDRLASLREIKRKRKQIKDLKKKSFWSRSLEEVMEKLVKIVLYLHLDINNTFSSAGGHKSVIGHMNSNQRLGPTGLALHYANIVLQIDSLVARSSFVPANARDTLYQSLPPNIKSALRSKLPSFHAVEELTVVDIKSEMEKSLHWLVPIATNTSKAHHGFGWVGEWANLGSEVNVKYLQAGVIRIETFHHADKDKVDYYILELLLWLHRLVVKSKAGSDAGKGRSAIKSPVGATLQKTNKQSTRPVTIVNSR